jgi:hypothetical protein
MVFLFIVSCTARLTSTLCTSASPPVLRGHRVTVASHECGKDWIDKVQGARFVSLGKSPLAGDARRAKFKQVCSVRRWVGCGRVCVDVCGWMGLRHGPVFSLREEDSRQR